MKTKARNKNFIKSRESWKVIEIKNNYCRRFEKADEEHSYNRKHVCLRATAVGINTNYYEFKNEWNYY